MTHAEKRPAHMENELANLKAMAESGEELWLGHTAALLLYNYITHLKAALAEERKRCEELENACEEYEMEAKAQEDGRLHGKILCLEAEIERDRAEIARLREENRVLQESVMATDSEMFRLRARIANPGQTQYCAECERLAREVERLKGEYERVRVEFGHVFFEAERLKAEIPLAFEAGRSDRLQRRDFGGELTYDYMNVEEWQQSRERGDSEEGERK